MPYLVELYHIKANVYTSCVPRNTTFALFISTKHDKMADALSSYPNPGYTYIRVGTGLTGVEEGEEGTAASDVEGRGEDRRTMLSFPTDTLATASVYTTRSFKDELSVTDQKVLLHVHT